MSAGKRAAARESAPADIVTESAPTEFAVDADAVESRDAKPVGLAKSKKTTRVRAVGSMQVKNRPVPAGEEFDVPTSVAERLIAAKKVRAV